MIPILTVTLNPCIDLATSVEQVIAGPKLRCRPPLIDPGGGGVNVARAIRKLGGDSTALVVVGGATGDQLLALLENDAIKTRSVRLDQNTRQSFAVTDEASGAQYRFGLPGDPLDADDAKLILHQVSDAAQHDALVVLSGSLTPGLPVDFPAQLFENIAPKTDHLIVDISGPALANLVSTPRRPLYILRIDQKEAGEAAGGPLDTLQSSISFATGLIDRGVARIVVTGRGPDGSIMVTKDRHIFCTAPNVPVVSKIGAGDAFVGALTLSISKGQPLEEALRWGVAAASATVMTEGTALCRLEDVQTLLADCVIGTP